MLSLCLPLFGIPVAMGLSACVGGGDQTDPLWENSQQVTLETWTGLGPHQREAQLIRGPVGQGRATDTVIQVAWADRDNYSLVRRRNGRLSQEVRVIGGVPYVTQGNETFREAADAELYRRDLEQGGDLWSLGLDPFHHALQVEMAGREVIEGRPVAHYTLSLQDPLPTRPAGAHKPLRLTGEVWLDEATSLRLVGRYEGEYAEQGDETRQRRVSMSLTTRAIGEPPAIVMPEKVDKRRPVAIPKRSP